jgi:DNA-binding transcriptional regulator PaaX
MSRTPAAAAFFERYPVPLREALISPMVFRHNTPFLADAPHPDQRMLSDLARFAGHRDGAIRTALSRMRASGELEPFEDDSGRVCYRLNEMQLVISAVASNEERSDGVIVAITEFHRGEESNRKYLRDLLQYTGFHPLARNAYVSGVADTSPVERALEERGLRDRLWLFRSRADDPALVARLAEVFDVEARVTALTELGRAFETFLGEPGIDGPEFARRLMCAGPVHYRVCFLEEPPLPPAVLPEDYPLLSTTGVLARFLIERGSDLSNHYRQMAERSP